MSYWAVAQLQPARSGLALHCLRLANFEVYQPLLRERRVRHGRRAEVVVPLFVGYCFVSIQLQWIRAQYCPGVLRIVSIGQEPARVSDRVIDELRGRERNGAIELPKPRGLHVGDPVRVRQGPFLGHIGVFAGMQPHERVAVLLALLGGQTRVELPRADVEVL
jgi:transcriptional antiterminator RfaH